MIERKICVLPEPDSPTTPTPPSPDLIQKLSVIIRSQLPGSILYKPWETQVFFSVIASKSPAIPQSIECLLFPEMGRLFIQHYRLGLKIGQQPLDTSLAPDTGLFKSPEGDGKLSLEAVVPHRADRKSTRLNSSH